MDHGARWALAASLSLLLVLAVVPGTATAAGDPNPGAATWLVGDWDLRLTNFTHLEVDGTLRVHKTLFRGEVRSADEVRAGYDDAEAAGEGEAYVAEMEQALEDEIRDTVADLFPAGSSVTVDAVLDRTTLEDEPGTDDHHPALVFTITASLGLARSALGLPTDADLQQMSDVLAMGGVLSFDLELQARAGRNQTYRIHLPDGTRLTGSVANATSTSADAATFTLVNWLSTDTAFRTAGLAVTSANATVHDAPDGQAHVRIDLRDVETDLAAGTARVDVVIDADVRLRVVEVPDAMKALMPSALSLDHVNADGLRLALDRGYLTRAHLDQGLEVFEDRLATALSGAFGPDAGPAEVALDEASLARSYDPRDLRADDPVVARATAQAKLDVDLYGGGAQALAPAQARTPGAAALTLTSFPAEFALPNVPGLPTTYEVVLPPGLVFDDADVSGAGATSERTVDEGGREVLLVSFPAQDEEASAALTMSVGVTPAFLLHEFPLLVLALVILVALGVALAVHRRRRKRRRDAAGARADEAGEPGEAGGDVGEDASGATGSRGGGGPPAHEDPRDPAGDDGRDDR